MLALWSCPLPIHGLPLVARAAVALRGPQVGALLLDDGSSHSFSGSLLLLLLLRGRLRHCCARPCHSTRTAESVGFPHLFFKLLHSKITLQHLLLPPTSHTIISSYFRAHPVAVTSPRRKKESRNKETSRRYPSYRHTYMQAAHARVPSGWWGALTDQGGEGSWGWHWRQAGPAAALWRSAARCPCQMQGC